MNKRFPKSSLHVLLDTVIYAVRGVPSQGNRNALTAVSGQTPRPVHDPHRFQGFRKRLVLFSNKKKKSRKIVERCDKNIPA